MTRLLIATDNHPPRWDGISRFLTEVIPRLESFHVTIISPDYGSYEIETAEHIKLPTTNYSVGDYTVPKPRLKTIKEVVEQADIVFGQSIGPIGSTTGHYARKTKTPLTHYTHSIEWQLVAEATEQHTLKRLTQQVTRWYAKWYYNQAQRLITPSRTIRESLHYEGITTPTSIVPLGVNHDVFKPVENLTTQEQRRVVEKKRKLCGEDSYLIGYHGRIAREKNLLTLLRAVKRLRKRRTDFKVVLIGDGLDSIREKFNADPACLTLPAQPNVHEYVQAFDIYVSPSLTETTSLSTVEAMACGKPIVATPAGYIEDYVEHEKNGLLFEFEDYYELSTYIERLLDDEAQRQHLGRNAHKTAKKTFQWKKTAKSISNILHDLHD